MLPRETECGSALVVRRHVLIVARARLFSSMSQNCIPGALAALIQRNFSRRARLVARRVVSWPRNVAPLKILCPAPGKRVHRRGLAGQMRIWRIPRWTWSCALIVILLVPGTQTERRSSSLPRICPCVVGARSWSVFQALSHILLGNRLSVLCAPWERVRARSRDLIRVLSPSVARSERERGRGRSR